MKHERSFTTKLRVPLVPVTLVTLRLLTYLRHVRNFRTCVDTPPCTLLRARSSVRSRRLQQRLQAFLRRRQLMRQLEFVVGDAADGRAALQEESTHLLVTPLRSLLTHPQVSPRQAGPLPPAASLPYAAGWLHRRRGDAGRLRAAAAV